MAQRAGWYDDPQDPSLLRYFDGVVWTAHTTTKAAPAAAPVTTPIPQAPTQQVPTSPPPYSPPPQYGAQSPQYGAQPPQYGAQSPQYGAQPPQDGPPSNQYGSPPPQYGAQQQPGATYPGYQAAPAPYAGYGALGVKTTPDGVPLASYGQRVGAFLLDRIILAVLVAVCAFPWISRLTSWYVDLVTSVVNDPTTTMPSDVEIMQQITPYLVPITIVGIAVSVLYNTLFLVRWGATPGMLAVGIRVRLRARPGNPSLLTALKRQVIEIGTSVVSFLPLLSLVGSVLMLLNYLWPLWDDKRQALHDKIAGTNVVLKPRGR